ncbi:MAG TPA: EVE domain-containing protein [Fibrobacteria bacterium]|nr:EVE domain-containing protein [Fibrobacteria bacterium]HOX50348.1 EVE domain-containing protein [Fibrobacteria bacterium]
MRHWLLKSEPDAYSWDMLVREKTGRWDGVRNYMARNNLRAMSVGDPALFYHSVQEKAVVGICQISRTAYPDPTAEAGDWSCVEVEPVRRLDHPVTLESIKAEPALARIAMLKYNRLSVVPLAPEEFQRIVEMGGDRPFRPLISGQ